MSVPSSRYRFVILQHNHPVPHCDLMMQHGDVLKTWRLPAELSTGCWLPSESLPDHRLHYLDYEGPVSNNRGRVSRLTSGTFEAAVSDDQPVGGTAKAFTLFDCDMASKLTCRDDGNANPDWRFE